MDYIGIVINTDEFKKDLLIIFCILGLCLKPNCMERVSNRINAIHDAIDRNRHLAEEEAGVYCVEITIPLDDFITTYTHNIYSQNISRKERIRRIRRKNDNLLAEYTITHVNSMAELQSALRTYSKEYEKNFNSNVLNELSLPVI